MKTEFKNAKVTVEKRQHGKQPAIFIIENGKVYMITTTPDGDFNVTDEGVVGERYDENGNWCGEKLAKNRLVKPYCYGDFPKLKEIKADYEELMKIVKDVKTIAQARAMEEKGFVVEINGVSIEEYVENGGFLNEGKTDENIEWIRFECYGCLDCIYVYTDGSPAMFNVWSKAYEMDFIDTKTIKEVESVYEMAVATTKNTTKQGDVNYYG
ncbi:MAG: hypothetical protein UGF89_12695 [Acutalibacteraceae bacterium]|nr:hypothetical protein [Acutalibacteraceae bacterium]